MNKICPSLLAIAVLLGLCGCATVDQQVSFNEADYQPYLAQGTASIFGHAFVRTGDGFKHNAAGLIVYLVPLTPYTEERARIMLAGKEPSPADLQMNKYLRSVVGDVGGRSGSTGCLREVTWCLQKSSGRASGPMDAK